MKSKAIALLVATTLTAGLLSACSSKEEAVNNQETVTNDGSPSAEANPNTETAPEKESSPDTEAPSVDAAPGTEAKPTPTPVPGKEPVANKDKQQKPAPNKEQAPNKGQTPSKDPAPGKEQPPSKDPGASKEPAVETKPSVKEMADEMLERVKQPMLIEMKIDQLKDTYGLDPALLEEFTVRYPLMNVKTNEIAIFKVKDEKEIATVKLAIEKRATVVQKQFEFYLPDQYENAKNYKIITNGKYVLFLISESADELGKAFSTFFKTS